MRWDIVALASLLIAVACMVFFIFSGGRGEAYRRSSALLNDEIYRAASFDEKSDLPNLTYFKTALDVLADNVHHVFGASPIESHLKGVLFFVYIDRMDVYSNYAGKKWGMRWTNK